MEREIPKILAINPGWRYMGIAIFHGNELREWAVKTLGKNILMRKSEIMRNMIKDFTERYGLNALAVKQLHPSRSSKNLRRFVIAMKKAGEQAGLKVYEYSLSEVKYFLLSEKGNKRQLAEEMAVRYPFLYPELEREKNSRNPYLARMFEAVALGVVCFNKLDPETQKVGRANK